MKICVLCNGYPTINTAANIFVAKLCDEFAEQGNEVTIIAPQSVTNVFFRKGKISPSYFEHQTRNKCVVRIYRPYTISFGKVIVLNKLNTPFRNRAIHSIMSKIGDQDIYYGHFWHNGYALYKCIKDTGKPLFVATGESVISFRTNDVAFKEYVKGVISVSSKNVYESIIAGLTTKDKCIVLPNAVDTSIFNKKDKHHCRQELGIDPNLFVVIYVGQFIERKGYNRVAEAMNLLNDKDIGVIFLGNIKEGQEPHCQGIIKCGFADHEQVAKYLNAADVFVLPSLAEGCSNAIVEAMACGLPIISSDMQFNYDILDSQNSILINPYKIEEIADAIVKVKRDTLLYESMEQHSIEKVQDLTLPVRAGKILEFINHMCL